MRQPTVPPEACLRTRVMARVGVWLVLGAAALAAAVGALMATGLWAPSGPPVDPTAGDSTCVDPPCAPESLPPLDALPLALPVLLDGLAFLLGCVLVLLGLLRWARPRPEAVTRGLLLLVGTVVVVIGAETVPHLVTPCLAGDIPGVCAASMESGIDYIDRMHLLGHAVFGWLPLTFAFWWLTGRIVPEPVGRSVA